MREILFRGKRLDNGEWVEGFYNHIPCGRFGSDEHMIQTVLENGKIGMLHDIDPSTVGQYTGLKDKEGKRIFEGDIVYVTGLMPHPTWEYDSVTGVVEWCGGAFEVEGRANDDYVPYGLLYDSCDACREIIGNIHDNPESRKEEGTV